MERICSQGEHILSFQSRPIFYKRGKIIFQEVLPLKVCLFSVLPQLTFPGATDVMMDQFKEFSTIVKDSLEKMKENFKETRVEAKEELERVKHTYKTYP